MNNGNGIYELNEIFNYCLLINKPVIFLLINTLFINNNEHIIIV